MKLIDGRDPLIEIPKKNQPILILDNSNNILVGQYASIIHNRWEDHHGFPVSCLEWMPLPTTKNYLRHENCIIRGSIDEEQFEVAFTPKETT